MSATILSGTALAGQLRQTIKATSQTLPRPPGLAVLLVGDDPASAIYVRNKVAACADSGIHSVLIRLPATASAAELLMQVQQLNAAPEIDGILVQLPLPAGIDAAQVMACIAPEKDVDGFHADNAGLLLQGQPRFKPCTPYGIMQLLAAHQIPLRGRYAVVVGASNIVGKPMMLLLAQAGATVTMCNSKTPDIGVHTRAADIVVMAVGRARLLQAHQIKPGATLIDVGINRDATGALCGDIDFTACQALAGAITPVPGGVGPMTIASLLQNTLESAQRRLSTALSA